MPKISELPYISSPTTADSLPIVDNGLTKKTTLNDLPVSAATQTALNAKADTSALTTHTTNTSNPHSVTKTQVGLSNVDNTSDVNKPVSTAQQTAISAVTSFRNKVRNPKMDIVQRGTSFPAAATAYTLDGWTWGSVGGQVVTVSQQADVMAGSECQNSLRVSVTTANAALAASNVAIIEQIIEGYLVRDLQGNPIAIRFEVRSPKVGTHCVALRNSGTDRSYIFTYNIAVANTWQSVTLTLPGGLITTGSWNWTTGAGIRLAFVLAAGSSYQTIAGAWQTGNFVATAAQVNCLDTVGNVFAVTGVQMEKGSTSTALEHRDIATEWLLNQRYGTTIPFLLGSVGNTANLCLCGTNLPVTMRATPIVQNLAISSLNIYGVGAGTGIGIPNPITISPNRLHIAVNFTNAGVSVGNPVEMNATGFVSAEL